MSIVGRLVNGRKRRTPEVARRQILEAAERRLRDRGVEGLNIVDVAKDCGMSHATLIHHFGSSAGMRRALVAQMTDRLLREVVEALQREPAPEPSEVLTDLFDALSSGGHAKLLAWLSVGEGALTDGAEPSPHLRARFAELVPVLARQLPGGAQREQAARLMIFLIATAAIGYGVAGARLPSMIGMAPSDVERFPAWLGHQIEVLLDRERG